MWMGRARVSGWYASAGDDRAPVDGVGAPLPWWALPAIEWIGSVLRPDDVVLEWGSGNSTLWLAARARRVVAIEHDTAWADRIRDDLPATAELWVHPVVGGAGTTGSADQPYVQAGTLVDSTVMVIDGMARTECAALAVESIGDGLVILDNADMQPAAHGLLTNAGLDRIDFVGSPPGESLVEATSAFSRNLLGWCRRAGPPRSWPPMLDPSWRWEATA